jgi:hypothetical protein
MVMGKRFEMRCKRPPGDAGDGACEVSCSAIAAVVGFSKHCSSARGVQPKSPVDETSAVSVFECRVESGCQWQKDDRSAE